MLDRVRARDPARADRLGGRRALGRRGAGRAAAARCARTRSRRPSRPGATSRSPPTSESRYGRAERRDHVMEFRILGPLEVTQDGRALELGATKQQTLLAVLLLHAGEIVSPTRLMTELWGEDPPSTATKGVQGYVSSLRRILGPDAIATRTPRLRGGRPSTSTPPCSSAWRPSGPLRRRARAVARRAAARRRVRGPGGRRDRAARGAAARRARAADRRRRSRSAATPSWSPSCEELVATHPLRERLRAQLMLALYRAAARPTRSRSTSDTRSLLVEELGIEPGEELRRAGARDARPGP